MKRTRTEKFIVTFGSTQDAMVMEKLGRSGCPGRLIPVPRSISASCGLCWMCEKDQEEAVRIVIVEEELRYEGFHYVEMY